MESCNIFYHSTLILVSDAADTEMLKSLQSQNVKSCDLTFFRIFLALQKTQWRSPQPHPKPPGPINNPNRRRRDKFQFVSLISFPSSPPPTHSIARFILYKVIMNYSHFWVTAHDVGASVWSTPQASSTMQRSFAACRYLASSTVPE
jgi:hypothetical protein